MSPPTSSMKADAIANPWKGTSLSTYRTEHEVELFAEFKTTDGYAALEAFAQERNRPIVIVGAGSNLLFRSSCVRTLVARNRMPAWIRSLEGDRLEVSSSVAVSEILKLCFERSLQSFYYLASVPATVGGALAMNAGRGKEHERSIYDFVESVTYWEQGRIITASPSDLVRGYRQTIFTGLSGKLIVSAIFHFPKTRIVGDPIRERVAWSVLNQDRTGPSCGSVFREANPMLLNLLRFLRFGKARFSRRTLNWIVNRGQSPRDILALITAARWLHRIFLRPIELELVEID